VASKTLQQPHNPKIKSCQGTRIICELPWQAPVFHTAVRSYTMSINRPWIAEDNDERSGNIVGVR
jgi:hypothetical protein